MCVPLRNVTADCANGSSRRRRGSGCDSSSAASSTNGKGCSSTALVVVVGRFLFQCGPALAQDIVMVRFACVCSGCAFGCSCRVERRPKGRVAVGRLVTRRGSRMVAAVDDE
jgi:hypothetical protein